MSPFFDYLSITVHLRHLFLFHFSLALISQEYECGPVYGNAPSYLSFNLSVARGFHPLRADSLPCVHSVRTERRVSPSQQAKDTEQG